tara:strand:- start:201 stop:587 length:387 start_codon:yes stop_codon:yes gene_type:complete
MNNQDILEVKWKKERQKSTESYYALRNEIDDMKFNLQSLRKHRGHSDAYRLLIIALDGFRDQISRDHRAIERRNRIMSDKNLTAELQTALNRERKKRFELEAKMKEALESSGLFISYVRKALKMQVKL